MVRDHATLEVYGTYDHHGPGERGQLTAGVWNVGYGATVDRPDTTRRRYYGVSCIPVGRLE